MSLFVKLSDPFKIFSAETGGRSGGGANRNETARSVDTFYNLATVVKISIPKGITIKGAKEAAHASMRDSVLLEIQEQYKIGGYEDRPTTKEQAEALKEQAEVSGQKGWNGLGVSLNLNSDGALSAELARQQEAELYKNFSLSGFKSSAITKEVLAAQSPNIGGVGINLIVNIKGEDYIFGGRKPESFIGEKQWHPSSGPMNFDEKAIDACKDLRDLVLYTTNAAATRGTGDFFERLLDASKQNWESILDTNAFYMSDAVTGTAAVVLQCRVTEQELYEALSRSNYDSSSTPLTGVKVSDLKKLQVTTGDKNEEVFSLPSGISVIEMSSENGLSSTEVSDEFVVRPAAVPYKKITDIQQ